ncbi:hypothetical protein ZIOFF_045727 [Zingiber officinale]|uniref:Bromo domain-containing protein n=1 Tax=Zingiber officinale TaxID=94328 RepID=A0A8J5G1H2_ZINOF|nr:hypothetical protein ZIOFF_045727 [Zingiber officinale]
MVGALGGGSRLLKAGEALCGLTGEEGVGWRHIHGHPLVLPGFCLLGDIRVSSAKHSRLWDEFIMKPMVFGTIKNQMEAKDGNWYKNVREIYADVRLVFTNAMKYNDDQSDVHVMAKSLLENFEEKWLPLLAEVAEEEARQKNEEAQTLANMRNSRKAAYSKIARETYNELDELNSQLEELRAMVIKKCRCRQALENQPDLISFLATNSLVIK